jgi:hypothetical protein
MSAIIAWIEQQVGAIPLPVLEVWGRFAYLVGLGLAISAYARVLETNNDITARRRAGRLCIPGTRRQQHPLADPTHRDNAVHPSQYPSYTLMQSL